jgi:hypothetical protein
MMWSILDQGILDVNDVSEVKRLITAPISPY